MSCKFSFSIKFLVAMLLCCSTIKTNAQTLIINEVSNGPTGNQEYVEFVVVSDTITYNCGNTTPPCLDIRGWIYDDNSGYHGGAGIAAGAVRFSQDAIWSCVPVGTIILIYNGADVNPSVPAADLSMADGNCRIVAPINNSTLFDSTGTTPGAVACSYPASGWTSGGNWINIALANGGDCARIVNLSGCEVFSLCYGTDNQNTQIYFAGSGGQTVYSFNGVDPTVQGNWTTASANPAPGGQTPGAANNAANAAYIAQFNNSCQPITPINVTAVSTNAGCACNGTATATASGSIAGYTYQWFDSAFNSIGQNTDNATGLCAGTYHVIANSSIGCSDTATVTITLNGTVSVSVNAASACIGGSATLTATPSAVGGTYSWSPGAMTTQSITVSPAVNTTYTVTYTLSSCVDTGIGTVTIHQKPNINVNAAIICSGQTATLTASGGSTYSWNTGSSANPLSVNPTTTTNYTVTGTDAFSCSDTAIAAVTVNQLPNITVNSPSICNGQSATLTANNGVSYSWNTGSIANPLTVSPTTTTNYVVTGTDANGCTKTATAVVTVNAIPTVTVNSPTICNGQSATLTGQGATTYAWSTGATTNPITVSPPATTNYTVIGSSAGCVDTAIATVTVTSASTITVNSATICSGQSATLTAQGGTTYSWNTGVTGDSITVAPTATTTYTVSETGAGCPGSATATVTVNPKPSVSVNSPFICNGLPVTLLAQGANSYSWSTGATTTSISVSPATTTTYTVIGTQGNCTDTAISTVIVTTPVSVSLNHVAAICAGTQVTLTAVASGGNAPTYNYSWNPIVSGTGSSVSVAPVTSTTYTVTVSDGCSTDTDTTRINILPRPNAVISSGVRNGCVPVCVNFFDASTSTSGTINSWTWTFGNGDSSIFQNPSECFPDVGSYTVTLAITTSLGCSATATLTNYVNVYPNPTAEFSNSLAGSDAFNQTIDFTNQSIQASTYVWNFGDTTYSSLENPSHYYSDLGTYTVTLVATSDFGCIDTVTHEVKILGGYTFYAPNVFTPNRDGINTIFIPLGIGWDKNNYQLLIFDRWGNKFFSTNDPSVGWDGKVGSSSDFAPLDVYVWKVKLKDIFGNDHIYRGNVTILK